MPAVLRAKIKVGTVQATPTLGEKENEIINAHGVYSSDPDSENAQWSKWTPALSLNMTINNPGAFGHLKQGQEYYLDFIPVESSEPSVG